jgi:hypothetical protein
MVVSRLFGLGRIGSRKRAADGPAAADAPATPVAGPAGHGTSAAPATRAAATSSPAATEGVDLSRLDRVQLLQLLRDAMQENDRLRAQLAEATKRADEAERRLDDRRIQIEDSESLAEASLRLAGVFADAQRAIDLYGYNVALNNDRGVFP